MSESSVPSARPASGASPEVLFTERLWPAPWVWAAALGGSLAGIFVFAPISITAGIIAAVVLAAISTTLLVVSTPTLVVRTQTLQVGRAQVDRHFIGSVEAFTGAQATAQRGPELNGIAYLCIRGWIDPVVRIEITDQADRTPYWLTSTRRPHQLVAALNRAA